MRDIWKWFLYKKIQTRGISFSMATSLKKIQKIKKLHQINPTSRDKIKLTAKFSLSCVAAAVKNW